MGYLQGNGPARRAGGVDQAEPPVAARVVAELLGRDAGDHGGEEIDRLLTHDPDAGEGAAQVVDAVDREGVGLGRRFPVGDDPLEHELIANRVGRAELGPLPRDPLRRGPGVGDGAEVGRPLGGCRDQLLLPLTEHGVVEGRLRLDVGVQRLGPEPDLAPELPHRDGGQPVATGQTPGGVEDLGRGLGPASLTGGRKRI
jgi:hypothetical protein